jgi:hypothetical protein
VYAVVRWDFGDGEPEHQISVTKVFRSERNARDEADRLNVLNAAKQCRYFVVVSRLVE